MYRPGVNEDLHILRPLTATEMVLARWRGLITQAFNYSKIFVQVFRREEN